VGVFSEADAELPYVRDVDEAVCIGPAPSAQSYLDGARLIRVALERGCDALHPGWGFLSERADFAAAVAAAGLLWIGPSAATIALLGDKETAKNTARGLAPLLEGGGGRGCSDEELGAAARKMGWPVLLKVGCTAASVFSFSHSLQAACGGGGRGQRVVAAESEWADALVGARTEAKNSFGDASLIVER
jgi:acetyl/propionyl-CoA carboxylase alpha subunit